ncbi:hypothetical protein HHI36_012456 [Cryptolaemus montrouzieri]|uniref:Uncharacterized protein n=1 Tax=Cryptolaemus montrouzieri TaxID=559131 RepID=A0ABD2NEA1_9CUCU
MSSSLSRAQSWPLLTGATPQEDNRQTTAKVSQIQARRLLCRHYYPEGGWGWVITTCTVLVHIINHGFQLSWPQLIGPAVFKFHVAPIHAAGESDMIISSSILLFTRKLMLICQR